jgi:hypothetical protein
LSIQRRCWAIATEDTCVTRLPKEMYKLVLLFFLLLRATISPLLRPAGVAFDVKIHPWQVFYAVALISVMIDSVWNVCLMF